MQEHFQTLVRARPLSLRENMIGRGMSRRITVQCDAGIAGWDVLRRHFSRTGSGIQGSNKRKKTRGDRARVSEVRTYIGHKAFRYPKLRPEAVLRPEC